MAALAFTSAFPIPPVRFSLLYAIAAESDVMREAIPTAHEDVGVCQAQGRSGICPTEDAVTVCRQDVSAGSSRCGQRPGHIGANGTGIDGELLRRVIPVFRKYQFGR